MFPKICSQVLCATFVLILLSNMERNIPTGQAGLLAQIQLNS